MEYASSVDVGKTKELNEDSVSALVFDETHLDHRRQGVGVFVLADGMGGELGGEQASYLATTVIPNSLSDVVMNLAQSYNPVQEEMSLQEAELPDYPSPAEIETAIHEAIEQAHEAICTHRSGDQGGTTVVAGVYAHGWLYLGWVGDSVAYVINKHEERIAELTQEHSQVQIYVEEGDIRPEVARVHNEKHVITRALGGANHEPEFVQVPIYGDDIVLFASDGLLDAYTDSSSLYRKYVRANNPQEEEKIIEEIMETVITPDEIKDHVLKSEALADAAVDLINLANERGGSDNISTLLFADPELVHRQNAETLYDRRTYNELTGDDSDSDVVDAETRFVR